MYRHVLFLYSEWCKRSNTVFFMGDKPQRYPIKQGSQKSADFWEEEERRQPQRAKRVLCCKAVLTSGPPMMSQTVLDLLHSLGVEDDMIMFDNFGG